MAIEIEHKFLLKNDEWRETADTGTRFRQGYLIGAERASVRVRIEGEGANINIKSATLGIRRQEYEYPIPLEDALELLDTLCEQPQIEKTRYRVPYGEHIWEVDVFAGDNEGLIVAEVELGAENEVFAMPPWAGKEVSEDTRYYNVCLVKHPFSEWRNE
jgi:adenylate cyclase